MKIINDRNKKSAGESGAHILGKSEQFVRCGLQYQRFSFGTAVTTNPDKKPRPHYSYQISPKKFMEYSGCTSEKIIKTVQELWGGILNKIYLVGNLTKDVYMRRTQSGKATARMSRGSFGNRSRHEFKF